MGNVYARPFLNKVIVKADFALPPKALLDTIPVSVNRVAMEHFPIKEPPAKMKQVEVLVEGRGNGEPAVAQKTAEVSAWVYWGRNREKRLMLNRDEYWIEYGKYENYQALREEFVSIARELFACEDGMQIQRLGLRYINVIRLDEPKPTDWKRYLSSNLLSSFKIQPNQEIIARAFHTLELNYGDIGLRFQYGMHNPDYPAPIRQKVFVLDYDGFHLGLIENLEDLRRYLDSFHEMISQMFEANITDNLRKRMS